MLQSSQSTKRALTKIKFNRIKLPLYFEGLTNSAKIFHGIHNRRKLFVIAKLVNLKNSFLIYGPPQLECKFP